MRRQDFECRCEVDPQSIVGLGDQLALPEILINGLVPQRSFELQVLAFDHGEVRCRKSGAKATMLKTTRKTRSKPEISSNKTFRTFPEND